MVEKLERKVSRSVLQAKIQSFFKFVDQTSCLMQYEDSEEERKKKGRGYSQNYVCPLLISMKNFSQENASSLHLLDLFEYWTFLIQLECDVNTHYLPSWLW